MKATIPFQKKKKKKKKMRRIDSRLDDADVSGLGPDSEHHLLKRRRRISTPMSQRCDYSGDTSGRVGQPAGQLEGFIVSMYLQTQYHSPRFSSRDEPARSPGVAAAVERRVALQHFRFSAAFRNGEVCRSRCLHADEAAHLLPRLVNAASATVNRCGLALL